MQFKINQPIYVRYLELEKEEGLTDLILTPTNPSGADQTPITFSDLGDGLYQASFTPNAIGWWQVRVSCVSKPGNVYAKAYFVGTEYTTYPTQEDGKIKDVVDRFGEVQASPTQYTLLGRLKDIYDKIVSLFETGLGKLKLWDGTEEASITADNKLETITLGRGKVSTLNSSNTPLGIDGVFPGTWEEVTDYALIVVQVYTDQISAIDGLEIQWSSNGTDMDDMDDFTIPANNGKTFTFGAQAKYFRIVYTNGGVAQSVFRLQTIFKIFNQKHSSHRIKDTISDQDDATLVKSILAGKYDSEFKNVQVSSDGRLLVSMGTPGIRLTNHFYWEDDSIAPLVADAWYKVLEFEVCEGYNLECISFSSWASNSTSSARACLNRNFGTFNHVTQTFTDGDTWTHPKFSSQLFVEVTTTTSGSVDLTITYTNCYGVTGRTATITVPNNTPEGRMYHLTLQAGDIGVLDVTNVTSDTPGAAGVTLIRGKTELFYEKMTSASQNYTLIASREAVIANEGDIITLEFTSSQTANAWRRISLLGTLVPV